MTIRPNEMLTLAAVGRELGVSAHTIDKWVRAGCLRSVRPEPKSRKYILRCDLEIFIEDMKFGENSEVSEVSEPGH